MSTKKRKLDKTTEEEEEASDTDAPPKKRQRRSNDFSSNSNNNSNTSNEDEKEETKFDANDNGGDISLESIQNILGFDPNDPKFESRYSVYKQFELISESLFKHIVLVLKNPNSKSKNNSFKLYQLVEIEYYLLGQEGIHCDVFAHCDDLQYETSGNWYFHKSGNNSVEGYKHMVNVTNNNKNNNSNDKSKDNDETDPKWVNPRPNMSYRGGSFQGLDITFAKPQSCFGGILIRAIQELSENSIHAAFTGSNKNDGSLVYSPGELVEGPSKCVDRILKETGKDKISSLVTDSDFDLNCFNQSKNKFMYFDLATKYNIQTIAPKSASKSKTKTKSKSSSDLLDSSNNIFMDRICCSSPRVGLTLNTKNLIPIQKTQYYDSMLRLKEEYVMAPYRFIRMSNAGKLKKYKALIAIAMVYGDYYKFMAHRFDKVKGFEKLKLKTPDSDMVNQVYDATKIGSKGILTGVESVENGRKGSKKTLKDGRQWNKLTNATMYQLFGACLDA